MQMKTNRVSLDTVREKERELYFTKQNKTFKFI